MIDQFLDGTASVVCHGDARRVPGGPRGKLGGLHACGPTYSYTVPPSNFVITLLFSKTRLKRKDFQEIVRLTWAHTIRLQQLHPFLLTTNVSNKSGNLLFAQR